MSPCLGVQSVALTPAQPMTRRLQSRVMRTYRHMVYNQTRKPSHRSSLLAMAHKSSSYFRSSIRRHGFSTRPSAKRQHYAVSSARNSSIARRMSCSASVSETHSKFSCMSFVISCRHKGEASGPSLRRAKCSPFTRERLQTSLARGWRMRE
jgi:hypothetical protein